MILAFVPPGGITIHASGGCGYITYHIEGQIVRELVPEWTGLDFDPVRTRAKEIGGFERMLDRVDDSLKPHVFPPMPELQKFPLPHKLMAHTGGYLCLSDDHWTSWGEYGTIHQPAPGGDLVATFPMSYALKCMILTDDAEPQPLGVGAVESGRSTFWIISDGITDIAYSIPIPPRGPIDLETTRWDRHLSEGKLKALQTHPFLEAPENCLVDLDSGISFSMYHPSGFQLSLGDTSRGSPPDSTININCMPHLQRLLRHLEPRLVLGVHHAGKRKDKYLIVGNDNGGVYAVIPETRI
jgi:hypothetical protein